MTVRWERARRTGDPADATADLRQRRRGRQVVPIEEDLPRLMGSGPLCAGRVDLRSRRSDDDGDLAVTATSRRRAGVVTAEGRSLSRSTGRSC